MGRFLCVLRSWLLMVSVIAAGNTLQCFRDYSFVSEKLYTASPGLVNGLQARTFGVWTLLSSVVRCLCALDIRNQTFLCHVSLSPSLASIAGEGAALWVLSYLVILIPLVHHFS
ncbi:ergosterol biosynthetic protein 28 homolog isoform X3 [Anas acuta]|uniref:ergosterol biosynthetic protein 28 homolog isoform X3 n=1 Tax=Anas acuta TaxID=28680 RepID=UPI0035C89A06